MVGTLDDFFGHFHETANLSSLGKWFQDSSDHMILGQRAEEVTVRGFRFCVARAHDLNSDQIQFRKERVASPDEMVIAPWRRSSMMLQYLIPLMFVLWP